MLGGVEQSAEGPLLCLDSAHDHLLLYSFVVYQLAEKIRREEEAAWFDPQ